MGQEHIGALCLGIIPPAYIRYGNVYANDLVDVAFPDKLQGCRTYISTYLRVSSLPHTSLSSPSCMRRHM